MSPFVHPHLPTPPACCSYPPFGCRSTYPSSTRPPAPTPAAPPPPATRHHHPMPFRATTTTTVVLLRARPHLPSAGAVAASMVDEHGAGVVICRSRQVGGPFTHDCRALRCCRVWWPEYQRCCPWTDLQHGWSFGGHGVLFPFPPLADGPDVIPSTADFVWLLVVAPPAA